MIATQPRFNTGDRVMAGLRDTVWTVREYDPQSGLYTVDGSIGGVWPTVRCFYEFELWPASVVESLPRSEV